jgi:hypothetical protein
MLLLLLFLKLRVTWSVSLIHWSVVRRARKPYWLAFSRFSSSRYTRTIFVWISQEACPSWAGGLSALNYAGILGPYLASVMLLL